MKYTKKDLFIDIGIVAGAWLLVMFYGFVRGVLGQGVNEVVTYTIYIVLWGLMAVWRPFASLYFAITNFNIITILISAGIVWHKRTSVQRKK